MHQSCNIQSREISKPTVELGQPEKKKDVANCTQRLNTKLGYFYIMCGTIHEYPKIHFIGRQ
jgi:hypothetical protein